MRWKLTLGMILESTKANTLDMSPVWPSLSALIALITSSEIRAINASGASSAANAIGAPRVSRAIVAPQRERVKKVLLITCFQACFWALFLNGADLLCRQIRWVAVVHFGTTTLKENVAREGILIQGHLIQHRTGAQQI